MSAPTEPSTSEPSTSEPAATGPTVVSDTLAFRHSTVAVLRAGEGQRLGFLHGMLGTPTSHPFLAAGAAAGYEVVAPCLPGFTGSPPDPELRTIYDWVVALSEILDGVGLTGQPVVACSVGAMVALELATVRPEAFSHLTVVAPFGLWDDTDPVHDPFATTLSNQRRLLTSDPTATSSFFDDPAGWDDDELVELGVDRYQTRTASASLIWPIPEHGLAGRLHRVSTPVSLVWGLQDQVVPVSYLDRFVHRLPNPASTEVVPEAGHLVAWERPAQILETITAGRSRS